MIYEVENLNVARVFLENNDCKVTLTNPQGSTKYYGMRVIDYIFQTLIKEFPNQVDDVLVNAYDDYSAYITAKELGYAEIEFFNRSS